MNYFVTGATGFLGARVVRSLLSAGHRVSGLARSIAAAERIRALGAEPVMGDLAQPQTLRAAALASDGVIHTAFAHGQDFASAVEEERRAVRVLIEALSGSGKLLIGSTATGVVGDTGPEPQDEDFPGQPDFPARIRMGVEEDLVHAAALDVRSVVIRPAVLVHGHAAGQFVPMLVAAAAKNGLAGYIGDGQNRIATVHADDLAELYLLAAEKAPAGSIFNGTSGDVATRDMAGAIAQGQHGVQAMSISAQDAADAWGAFPAMLLGMCNRMTGRKACEQLGWRPYESQPTLLEELAYGSYAAPPVTMTA
jgi:nucleoside-diphosphate-sugar epimerase